MAANAKYAGPKSERKAWGRVAQLATEMLLGARVGQDTKPMKELRDLAETMIAQVGASIHKNPVQILSNRVYAIEYRHKEDNLNYRHDFATGVRMYTDGDGMKLDRPDGKPIWKDFA